MFHSSKAKGIGFASKSLLTEKRRRRLTGGPARGLLIQAGTIVWYSVRENSSLGQENATGSSSLTLQLMMTAGLGVLLGGGAP